MKRSETLLQLASSLRMFGLGDMRKVVMVTEAVEVNRAKSSKAL